MEVIPVMTKAVCGPNFINCRWMWCCGGVVKREVAFRWWIGQVREFWTCEQDLFLRNGVHFGTSESSFR